MCLATHGPPSAGLCHGLCLHTKDQWGAEILGQWRQRCSNASSAASATTLCIWQKTEQTAGEHRGQKEKGYCHKTCSYLLQQMGIRGFCWLGRTPVFQNSLNSPQGHDTVNPLLLAQEQRRHSHTTQIADPM